MVYKFFDKKSSSGAIKTDIISNQWPSDLATRQLVEELHKPIIRNIGKHKVCCLFKDNIWGADLADMQLISKYNSKFRFLLCVIDIFSKYAWAAALKDKKRYYNGECFSKNFRWVWVQTKQNMGRQR